MRKINIKCQWYIIVIVVCLCCFSILCWAMFAKRLGTAILSRSSASIDSLWNGAVFKQGDLSRIDSVYTYFTTGEIKSVQVVIGKEKWLFYKSTADGNPIADFEGTNSYNSVEMNSILDSAMQMQEKLAVRGIHFATMIAPNKENIYSEFMPDTYTHSEISRTDILIDFLKENGVNIISPKAELLDKHSKFQLYYSYDTHWNQLGAYIGAWNVLKAWDIHIPALEERTIKSYNLAENDYSCVEDDLAKMTGLGAGVFNDELEYCVDGTIPVDWEKYGEEQGKGISYYSNPHALENASILLVGDSFRTAMIPVLRETFADVYVVHRSLYTVDLLDEIKPEYMLLEYVERYSNEMKNMDIFVTSPAKGLSTGS